MHDNGRFFERGVSRAEAVAAVAVAVFGYAGAPALIAFLLGVV